MRIVPYRYTRRVRPPNRAAAYYQYESVITLGVSEDYFDRTLYKPPRRTEAGRKADNVRHFRNLDSWRTKMKEGEA